jgi:hypothetical protein
VISPGSPAHALTILELSSESSQDGLDNGPFFNNIMGSGAIPVTTLGSSETGVWSICNPGQTSCNVSPQYANNGVSAAVDYGVLHAQSLSQAERTGIFQVIDPHGNVTFYATNPSTLDGTGEAYAAWEDTVTITGTGPLAPARPSWGLARWLQGLR